MTTACAPGKVILFGEHAVVYGRPAIAVPVTQVQARVDIEAASGGLTIIAADQNQTHDYASLDSKHPLATIIRLTLEALQVSTPPSATIKITSSIPIASGLGSGAAVSTALARALAAFYGQALPNQAISDLVYQVEKIHHGTPSGIDNTVIAYAQPVYFIREKVLEPFSVPVPFRLVIGDTGVASPTRLAVGDVRVAWQAQPALFERLFDACGQIADQARQRIETGNPAGLGDLMTQNQALLREMTVSSPELDRLVAAASAAGAWGAKLSGGGRGGNMIALVNSDTEATVTQALYQAGAKNVIATTIEGSTHSPL